MILENRSSLRNFEIFKNISDENLRCLEENASCISLQKGETLFWEHSKVENIYFLLQGNVTIYKENFNGKRKVIYMIGGGSFINEVIIDGKESSVSCDAFDRCQLLLFPQEKFLKILEKNPEIALAFINSMGNKIRRLYRQVKNSSVLSMEKKIAAKLWKLSKDYGEEIGKWTKINLKISNTLLAEMLGTNRETVSRGILKLSDKGYVEKKDGYFLVKSHKLRDFYRK
ncbi:MAG: Crp/Fnr family transcriptional regulator [Fusobacteriaceae bacterium]